jgi:ATP-dependent helicase/nuclease subunit B
VVAAVLRIAAWFADRETARRSNVAAIDAEIRGEIAIALDNERIFHLSAAPTGSSGGLTAPMRSGITRPAAADRQQVRMGLSPQLTLETAICERVALKDPGGQPRSARSAMSD